MRPPQPTKLQLFTKSDCPLCDRAKAVLDEIAPRFEIQVEEIDITTNMGLFTKYKNIIPVAEMDGKRLFVHKIKPSAFKRKLRWRRWRQRLAGFHFV